MTAPAQAMTSITDLAGRIQQLQALLAPTQQQAQTAGSSTSFASALAQAQGTAGAAGTGASATGASATGASIAASGATAATAGISATGTAPTGQDVVNDARRYLGVPYVWGGTDPSVGLDCSGLVQRVYSDLGVQLPRVAADQARAGQPVASLAQAQPGDVLAFGDPAYHVAIYIGNGQMIAAPEPGEKVKIQSVYQTPTTIRRFVPASDQATGAADPASPAAAATSLSGVPYADLFAQAGAKHGLSPALLAAVAKVESGYDPQAVSPAGAQGLMQIMPGTAAGLGVNPLDPAQAVDGAARLLSSDLAQFRSLPLAVAAYNAGAGAVQQYGGIPPYPETQAYVQKVQAAMAALGGGSLS